MRNSIIGFVLSGMLVVTAYGQQPFNPARGIILRGTVVTMDAEGTILQNGNILVRNGKIVAIWNGKIVPSGIRFQIGQAASVSLGPNALIFPGLINLHNHATYNFLHLWPAPSSHIQPTEGRPDGIEPYANRRQWRVPLPPPVPLGPPEHSRLVNNPQNVLLRSAGLDLGTEVIKYAEIKAILGGETAFEDANNLLRNIGGDRIDSRVPPISDFTNSDDLRDRMVNGEVDAWIVHLAEGVRDDQRREYDTYSSRDEFETLLNKRLLTDNTVLVHGNGLEPFHFDLMRSAPSIRSDGTGDGLGAKLVWSPLSNMLLYGQTTLIYPALKAGVTVSLGTDWSPSGSRNLLGELKIADIILRGSQQHAGNRDTIPALRTEAALDKLLVEMVTTNPAKTLRWDNEVGSIEAGKFADLLVITKSDRPTTGGLPDSPYRNLIDATEEDVRLVLVNGEPLTGDAALMGALKPGDYEMIKSKGGCVKKAIHVKGDQTLAYIEQTLRHSLTALGGDNPPPEGGPADNSNTYSYLKAHVKMADANDISDAVFIERLINGYDDDDDDDDLDFPALGLDPQGRLNLEAIQLTPLLVEDDDFYFNLLEGEAVPFLGTIADSTPPFRLYRSNFNHIDGLVNPFAGIRLRQKHYAVQRSPQQLNPCHLFQ